MKSGWCFESLLVNPAPLEDPWTVNRVSYADQRFVARKYRSDKISPGFKKPGGRQMERGWDDNRARGRAGRQVNIISHSQASGRAPTE